MSWIGYRHTEFTDKCEICQSEKFSTKSLPNLVITKDEKVHVVCSEACAKKLEICRQEQHPFLKKYLKSEESRINKERVENANKKWVNDPKYWEELNESLSKVFMRKDADAIPLHIEYLERAIRLYAKKGAQKGELIMELIATHNMQWKTKHDLKSFEDAKSCVMKYGSTYEQFQYYIGRAEYLKEKDSLSKAASIMNKRENLSQQMAYETIMRNIPIELSDEYIKAIAQNKEEEELFTYHLEMYKLMQNGDGEKFYKHLIEGKQTALYDSIRVKGFTSLLQRVHPRKFYITLIICLETVLLRLQMNKEGPFGKCNQMAETVGLLDENVDAELIKKLKEKCTKIQHDHSMEFGANNLGEKTLMESYWAFRPPIVEILEMSEGSAEWLKKLESNEHEVVDFLEHKMPVYMKWLRKFTASGGKVSGENVSEEKSKLIQ